jgi:lysozyme
MSGLGLALYPRIETARLWYEVVGIDVSHHQGKIDWPRVAEAGVAFSYIKATEGGSFVDPAFTGNWNEARAAGLSVGAYHFFTLCKAGSEQAANFIATVPKVDGAMPPAIDAEHMGPCPGGDTLGDPAREIGVLLDLLAAHYGCRPIIYTTPEFARNFMDGRFPGETFWLRSIFVPPFYKREGWEFWQYHERGFRPGINGPVDLDAFRGTRAEFQAFLNGHKCQV